MNDVSTQTILVNDKSTQIGHQDNINLVIRELPFRIPTSNINQNSTTQSFDCKYNKIMNNYHKMVNEVGHSILNWREYDLIHNKLANITILELRKEGLKIPYWLLNRSKKNSYNS